MDRPRAPRLSRHRRATARAVFLAALVVALVTEGGLARATGSRTREATFTSVDYGWERVERWKDNGSMFQSETYAADGRTDQTGQRRSFFGTGRPHSSRFLLYYAPGWDTGSRPVPVLLVHGAGGNADKNWANPSLEGRCGASTCPTTGLMQYLDGRGFKVFAVNFPHNHGNNYYWAEQLYDAVEIIKARTGASQVDVVAWSKGGFAARQYVSSVRLSGGTAFGGNVRKLLLVGAPNLGIDYSFRHGINPSVGVYPECGINANAPAVHTTLVCYGGWYDHPELTLYRTSSGDAFPGQKQMLRRWDGSYALPSSEQDWWTTYHGGWGYVSYSPGIDEAIAQGSLVGRIRSNGVPSSVQTYLYCGGSNDIPNIHNEHTGPSDGVVFRASCGNTGGIGRLVQNVTNTGLNHFELGWNGTAMSQLATWLAQ